MPLFGSNEAHGNALNFWMEFIFFLFCLRNIVRMELITANKNTSWSNERNYNANFGGFLCVRYRYCFPDFQPSSYVFFKTNFSILLSGIPHADMECNDTVILGFMMAQFIADFHYQVPRAVMLPAGRKFGRTTEIGSRLKLDKSWPFFRGCLKLIAPIFCLISMFWKAA